MWNYIERWIVRYLCPFFEYIKSKWKSTSNIKQFFCIFENFSEVKLYIWPRNKKLETFAHSQSILHTLANIHLKLFIVIL